MEVNQLNSQSRIRGSDLDLGRWYSEGEGAKTGAQWRCEWKGMGREIAN